MTDKKMRRIIIHSDRKNKGKCLRFSELACYNVEVLFGPATVERII